MKKRPSRASKSTMQSLEIEEVMNEEVDALLLLNKQKQMHNVSLKSKPKSKPKPKYWNRVGLLLLVLFVAAIGISTYLTEKEEAATEENEESLPGDAPSSIVTTSGRWELVKSFPHDSRAFTQGLVFDGKTSTLYESTGLHSRSSIRKIDAATGTPLLVKDLGSEFFGEGITVLPSGDLLMLTWQEKTGFIFDGVTLEEKARFEYTTKTGEGWGVTTVPGLGKGENATLCVSDGSATLAMWDADTLEVQASVEVKTSEGKKVNLLNELEHYKGMEVLANVWFSDNVYRITMPSGIVNQVYDFSSLWPKASRPKSADVLNGIAVLANGDLLLTGKLWPAYYVVKLLT